MATNDAPPDEDKPKEPLLSIRTALVLLLAVLSGVVAAVLTLLAGHSGFECTLVGLAVGAGAVKFFDWLIK